MLPFHPYADIFPLIQGDEFAGLVADIKVNGLREKIVTLDGAILDGRNRYLAALAGGLVAEDELPADRPMLFQRFVPAIDGDALKFVFSKNIHRRHLTTGQRAYAMAEFEKFRHGGVRKTPADQDANLQLEQTIPAPETRADLAEQGHISERSIASAAVVRDSGVTELKTAVKQGAIAVSAAEQIARLPEAEQPAELARHLPSGSRSIMSSRQEPDDSLDYFPTPPWATRALCEHVLPRVSPANLASSTAWEPACGEGHMAEVLGEYFRAVTASDVFNYGYGLTYDFLAAPAEREPVDWIVTNPPFGDSSEQFVLRAIERAHVGVAMFLRLQWLESVGRYERIFQQHPPVVIAQFAERVPLHKARWEPDGATATAYLWIIWRRNRDGRSTEFMWIPPGCRKALSQPDDVDRFTAHPVIKRAPADCSNLAADPSSDPNSHAELSKSESTNDSPSPVRPCSQESPAETVEGEQPHG